ncbi:hypothetical protein JW964_03795 [candidate division KSB1 bacterium]|nr:hypothetical protein [candidate division KSB1 bacterium]
MLKQMARFLACYWLVILLIDLSASEWGQIQIQKDGNGQVIVAAENERLAFQYGHATLEGKSEGLMKKFYLKAFPAENIPHTFEGAAHRGIIKQANVLYDGTDRKTVRVEWAPQAGIKEKYNHPAVTDISIFSGSNFIQLTYQSFCYPHICDIGHPGGLAFEKAADTTAQGRYVIYGADSWQQIRSRMDAPELRRHENPHHQLTNILYPCYPNPLIDTGWIEASKNPMSYKGWYILGVYNPENGRGFGRVIPVDIVSVIKLLWGKGFEYFPLWNEGGVTRPFTSYLFIVTQGSDEIIATGKKIVDQIEAAGPMSQNSAAFFTVSSDQAVYNSPLLGNGEIVTTIGPTGYHNGHCPEQEHVNRTIFWAGRRLKDARSAKIRIPRVPPEELIGPTIPLIRFGRLFRTLKINDVPTTDHHWRQILNPDFGTVVSELTHDAIVERTESVVCLTANLLIFRTQLTNFADKPQHLEFALDYEFGDADGERAAGTRLHIRRPYPDDLEFGNIEGTRALATDIEKRPPHLRESLSVQYEIEGQLGEVHLGRYPNGIIKDTETGGRFIHEIDLVPHQSTEIWFWVMLSDRTKYSHFPTFEIVQENLEAHYRSWQQFWETSQIEINNPPLSALRKACLYTLRCNASPWTVPPGYLSTHWEGRTFHDEFYPFMGLISSNYKELAERIPNYRLNTLPYALQRGIGRGAYYGWEVTETGEESAPYGHWVDEQFRHGQISESAWRYYLHTGDLNALKRFYPMLKGCANWMVYDVLRRDANGRLTTRTVADVSEHVISAQNSIFVVSATIRSLENAVRAAEIIDLDSLERTKWQKLAHELRENLPLDDTRQTFRYADNIDIPTETAHLGMVYPFSIELNTPRVKNTLAQAWEVYQKSKMNATNELVFSYNWIWAVGRLATICFYLGEADKGYQVLNQAPKSIGPFMAPNEHYGAGYGAFLPWLTSGAGAFIYAMNAMFVQVIDEQGAILLPAVPAEINRASFKNLAADASVSVSGEVAAGKPIKLIAHSVGEQRWCFRIDQKMVKQLKFCKGWTLSGPDPTGLVTVSGKLKPGDNYLIH